MLDKLNSEIEKTCKELIAEAKIISQLQPVSHLSKSSLQFVGGILGGIREYRENTRLEKLINAPICYNWTFYTYASHLINITEELVKKQIEVQGLASESDPCYLGNVELIASSVDIAHKAWFDYSPDMAWEGIKVGNQDNVSLELTVDTLTKEEFRKLRLPEGLSIPEDKKQSNSGCFAAILLLIVPLITILFL